MSKFAGISDADLAAQFTEAETTFNGLISLEAPTVEQVEQASAAADQMDEIIAEQGARQTAQVEAAAKFDALKNRTFSAGPNEDEEKDKEKDGEKEKPFAAETEEQPEAPAEGETESGEPTETPEVEAPAEETPAEEPAEAPAEGTATAQASTKSVAQMARKIARPDTTKKADMSRLSITASADVPNFSAGTSLDSVADLAQASLNRMKGFTPPNGDGKSENLQKFGVARIALDFPEDLQINRNSDDMEVLANAARESRLEGESLTAAGGWCSPSETLYDLLADESLEGILSVPEVQVNRGGIRYTRGPEFSDFYSQAGFVQTEAQAIAGTTKPCYEVTCPEFEDVRLDAIGVCIKVPILTNAAYPELVQRFTSGTMIAHQHMVNANVINRMVTMAGAARVVTGLGATVTDTLEALELVADQRRQKYRLPLNRTMEVVLPFWVKGAMRADLARRNGLAAAEQISDATMTAHFTARNLTVSFVYDWQVIDETVEQYPATYQALVYPAGTFIKGVSDVINLSAVYDAASLAVNTYTGLFMEQGLLVASLQYDADLLTLPICNAGRTGAADLTCTPTV